jgi:hypothetical protein
MHVMSLLPSPWRLLASGVRRGNTPMTVAGAALVVLAIMRRVDGPVSQRVYARKLGAGQRLMISVVTGRRRQRTR